jgi:ATP-dependent DNA helicase RecG
MSDLSPSGAAGELRAVTTLRGVGKPLAARLAKLGVHQLQDLLFLLPRSYEDRTRIHPMGALRDGQRACVSGEILHTEVTRTTGRSGPGEAPRRGLLRCRIADGTGFLTLRFFHFRPWQPQQLARGARIRCFGDVNEVAGELGMTHPEYRVGPGTVRPEETLTPIYPLTAGLQQGQLRALMRQGLEELGKPGLPDWLPPEVTRNLGLPSIREALNLVHMPPRDASLEALLAGRHPGQRRLAFEELLAHHLQLKLMKQAAQSEPAWPLEDALGLQARFLAALPFRLTGAQARALSEVDRDLVRQVRMTRLVQGDVGCGKTVVAAAAAARAAGSGLQAALMAPTELLAEQHWKALCSWLEPLGITVARLAGSQPARERRATSEALASGQARVAVGTHALFQEDVQFASLALVIVDEQHRFGVQQRLRLQEKAKVTGRLPHQLIMTATPIPRTLAMTAYADLDISVIDELPPGRTPVRTVALPEQRRHEVVARILEACTAGRRAYWVCPLIEESDGADAQAAEKTAQALTEALPGVTVGLVHGRMPAAQKDEAMRAFKEGRTQLLVATTVIEVGVDVPEATLMIIENAERLGLAQLHQLRGRVGRGSLASSCLLMYRPPLSEAAHERLKVLRETQDGFEIAHRDLQLRGAGELLGTRQTGLAQLRVADLARDSDLLSQVRDAADLLLAAYPDNIAPLAVRWIGHSAAYGRVG